VKCPSKQPTRRQELGACPWPVLPEEDNVNLWDLLLEEPPTPKPRPRKVKVRVVKR
jgi:hypothetical protein